MTVAMKKTLVLLLLLAGLTEESLAETLTWCNSRKNMTWSTKTSDTNWKGTSTLPISKYFTDGSDVVFGDIGSGEVTLVGTLAPASVTVATGNDYTFAGDGELTGDAMQLVKEGAGTLTINTSNSYKGGTLLKEGALVLGDSNALGNGNVTMGDNTTLKLGTKILSNKITLEGSATIGGGTLNSALSVGNGKKLTLCGNLSGSGTISLDLTSVLDLDGNTLSNSVTTRINATIQNGTLSGDVNLNGTISLIGDVFLTGNVTLGRDVNLSLGQNALSCKVTLSGNASIQDGTLNSDIAVGDGCSLRVYNIGKGNGSITLGDKAILNTTNSSFKAVTMSGSIAYIRGDFSGNLIVGAGRTLYLRDNLTKNTEGLITLESSAVLDLQTYRLMVTSVTLTGDKATIQNGWLLSDVSVNANQTLYLKGSMDVGRDVALADSAKLAITAEVGFKGGQFRGTGTIVKEELGTAALDFLGLRLFSGSLDVQEGGLNILSVDGGLDLKVADVTIAANGTLGVYKSATVEESNEGTLIIKNGNTLTAGADAHLNADLIMEAGSKLDVSTAQEESMGKGIVMGCAVTLHSGLVLVDETHDKALYPDINDYLFEYLSHNDYYYLYDSVEELYIQQGDETKPVSHLDFVNWRNFDMDASRIFSNLNENTYALVYNWDPIHENVVALRMIPEPTTGTLSLLALAGLCMRRRRK